MVKNTLSILVFFEFHTWIITIIHVGEVYKYPDLSSFILNYPMCEFHTWIISYEGNNKVFTVCIWNITII